MKKYTSEHLDQLEQRLPEYLMAVNPGTFSWSNEKDIDKLVEWLEVKDKPSSNATDDYAQFKEAKHALIVARRSIDNKLTEYEINNQTDLAHALEPLAIQTNEAISFALGVIHHLEKENKSLKRQLSEKP